MTKTKELDAISVPLLAEAVEPLLAWYREDGRSLPWREEPTPYHVWLSEIMLQQTRIAAVIPYYHRFLEALPTVRALAEIEDGALMKLWEGLGYYSRARNLKAAARRIVEEHGGDLPRDYKSLLALPGIGEKRAADIIAYREAHGPFLIPEAISDVPGIGLSTLENIINLITVEEDA